MTKRKSRVEPIAIADEPVPGATLDPDASLRAPVRRSPSLAIQETQF